jgi:glucose-6-phosphate isomerase
VVTDPRETAAGRALQRNKSELADTSLRELLGAEGRVEAMTLRTGDLSVDLSRARANSQTLSLLCELALEVDLPGRLRAMTEGQHINSTEDRPALHTALRLPPGTGLVVDGRDVAAEVQAVYSRMHAFTGEIHEGRWRGHTGQRITTVVNIGIGGSDLGPRMVVRALRQHHVEGIEVRFASNVDPADLAATVSDLDPASTLFVVVSKTFTTVETLTNARAARHWLTDSLGPEAVGQHMVAVSAATDRAVEFGIKQDAVFGFWDWVGGRYSLSSPVGLAIELAIGSDAMRDFRAGMHVIDTELTKTPLSQNAACLLGLLDVWYSTFWELTSKAVVPYAQDLELLPAHMQQLQMESNGKSTTVAGDPVTWRTCPSVWGTPGTNGQHAYFQLLHQGTDIVPVDFIGVMSGDDEASALLKANLVAQASTLALGRSAEELRADGVNESLIPHRTMPGNRPSTMILLPDLQPGSVGQLIALYEHSTAVAGLVWGINPFDQWGVELGKQRASALLPALTGGDVPAGTDPATAATLAALRRASA